MKRLTLAGLASLAALAATGIAGAALAQAPAGRGMDMGMGMKAMDADGDGVVTREEFVRFHEAQFDRMKNKDGVIAMKDMPKDCPMMSPKAGKDAPAAKGRGPHDHEGKEAH